MNNLETIRKTGKWEKQEGNIERIRNHWTKMKIWRRRRRNQKARKRNKSKEEKTLRVLRSLPPVGRLSCTLGCESNWQLTADCCGFDGGPVLVLFLCDDRRCRGQAGWRQAEEIWNFGGEMKGLLLKRWHHAEEIRNFEGWHGGERFSIQYLKLQQMKESVVRFG